MTYCINLLLGNTMTMTINRLKDNIFYKLFLSSLRCEDFFVYCEYDLWPVLCCDGMFNPKPIFSSQGACFTSQHILKPENNGALRVVLNVSKEYSQG